MAPVALDRLQGTLDMLVLRTLLREPMHGWGIAQRIQLLSKDVLQVNQGSLYPALHRLEERGWVAAQWGTSENNRRARFYRLTPKGLRQLEREKSSWNEFASAVSAILQTA
jgi:PadR family transcriptional regulator, regulatory protein PadR